MEVPSIPHVLTANKFNIIRPHDGTDDVQEAEPLSEDHDLVVGGFENAVDAIDHRPRFGTMPE